MSEIKEKIRPLYSELQGYLSQAPEINVKNPFIEDSSLWESVNEAIALLENLLEVKLNRFKIFPNGGRDYVDVDKYRGKLGG